MKIEISDIDKNEMFDFVWKILEECELSKAQASSFEDILNQYDIPIYFWETSEGVIEPALK
jgi:succinate dehydrogenase flavin-adding protein (antitoxin of CptAB toxin-antitoxin module)